jgi:hypothetical protein
MAKYLCRACLPAVTAPSVLFCVSPGSNRWLQAVNGQCLGCSYRLAWIVIRGGRGYAVRATSQRQLLT